MAFDQLPGDPPARVVGGALVHDARDRVRERPVHDVAVAGYPADVRRAPEHVALGFEIEDVAARPRHAGEVAAGRVGDDLRPRGRARRVEDEERVLGVEWLAWADRVGRRDRVLPPDVTSLAHLAGRPGVRQHDDRLELVELLRLRIDGRLERHHRPLAHRAVGGYQRLRAGEAELLAHRLCREAVEHDVVRRANSRAGQHRDRDLRNHRQVDANDVALADAPRLEYVGEPLDFTQQVGVGDSALLASLAAPVERDAIAEAGLHVAIDTVVAGVDPAADEPLVERRPGLVEHRLPRLRPVEQLACLRLPPGAEIPLRLFVDRVIADQRRGTEVLRRLEPLDREQAIELGREFGAECCRLGRSLSHSSCAQRASAPRPRNPSLPRFAGSRSARRAAPAC